MSATPPFASRSISALALIAAMLATIGPSAAQQSTAEERGAASLDAKARSANLEIDRECKPGLMKRAYLSAAPAAAKRLFWKGQRYAIARKVEGEYAALRARRVSEQADRQIAAIEARRDAALGIPQAPIPPDLAREFAKTDQLMNRIDADLLAATLLWAKKCNEVADQRVAEAELEIQSK